MSETTTEKPVSKSSNKDSGLTKKVGPMPIWAWGASATGAALIFFLYMKHRNANASTASSPTGMANASPSYAAVPAGGGSGYYYDGSYPVASTGDTGSAGAGSANAGVPSHPYLAISDIADLQQAIQAGIPQDWLAYAGTDPKQAEATKDPTYAPPQGLSLVSALPSGSAVAYGGVANQIAAENAPKVYGATRNGTLKAMQQWYQAYQQYGQNIGFYVPN